MATTNKKDEEIGLALAGGIVRAASCGMGLIRGFVQKQIVNEEGKDVPAMNMISYNSGISGGAIPAVLYAYADVPTDQLLDTARSYKPSKITLEDLDHMPPTSMGYVFAEQPGQLFRVIKYIFELILGVTNIFKLHSMYVTTVYRKSFKPFGIPKNKNFTSGPEELEEILKEHPDLTKDDFLIPREEVRTMPLLLFSMMGARADLDYMSNYDNLHQDCWHEYHAQHTLSIFTAQTSGKFVKLPNMTQLVLSHMKENGGNVPIPFTGTASSIETRYTGKVMMKGQEVAFPLKPVVPFKWGDDGLFGEKRFSLELMTSMSTNFPGMTGSFSAGLLSNLRTIKVNDEGQFITQQFADGGATDLMGIIPLVQHRVKNIIGIFDYNVTKDADLETSYADICRVAGATDVRDPDFDAQFHQWLKMMTSAFTCLFGYFGTEFMPGKARILNHIFDDPHLERMKELMVKYNSLQKAGEPLIVNLKDLKILDNPFWGVTAEDFPSVNLTMIWMNMPKKFSKRVPIEAVPPPPGMPKIDEDGRFNNEEMRSVPELKSEVTNYLTYTNKQINMMGYLGSWLVHHAWYGLKGHDGRVVFDGFAEIFDGIPEVKDTKTFKQEVGTRHDPTAGYGAC